jgi:hypothetical protein
MGKNCFWCHIFHQLPGKYIIDFAFGLLVRRYTVQPQEKKSTFGIWMLICLLNMFIKGYFADNQKNQ